MRRILLATRNHHKTREFSELLGPNFEISDLNGKPGAPEVEESGVTFEENARLKAIAASNFRPGLIVVADDSGLEVDALQGAPGVHSARYAEECASDLQNVRKLLVALEQADALRAEERSARFRCVLVAARAGEALYSCSGVVNGQIARTRAGTKGFGYDSVFVPEGYTETFGELDPGVKRSVSHRARAVEELQRFLDRINP